MQEVIRSFWERTKRWQLSLKRPVSAALVQLRSHGRRPLTFVAILLIVSSGLLIANTTNAANTNVLRNGNFEGGFESQAGCGMVGVGWQCFTNGGATNYGFYDDQWNLTVADGGHSQLLEVNAKGITSPDNDRYSGIYQTVRVMDWSEYTLNLSGMIRTTTMDGDPWRYRVQVGWTEGGQANWSAVNNWIDVGWDKYYDRLSPGSFSNFSTKLMAEADFITIYVRVWRKWGMSGEELDVNFDTISLTGPAPFDGGWNNNPMPGPGPDRMGPGPDQRWGPPPVQPPAPAEQPTDTGAITCGDHDQIWNGGFEQGFNALSAGHVGKGWGFFTNGGAANYGFYDEQWSPVIAEGSHGQLIELNAKGVNPADTDRYAGIYQQVKRLQPGVTYQLTIKGMLCGAGNEDDPNRYEAQWGYNLGFDTDWQHVGNWTGMDLGPIYPRTGPGPIGAYTIQFEAKAPSLVLFIRGWKKWGITDQEMDLNLDAISLQPCHKAGPKHPHGDWKSDRGDQPIGGPVTDNSRQCTYTVQPGDWLSAIANQLNVSVIDLMRANSINNANFIYVGQVLQIPGCSNDAPPMQQGPMAEPPKADPPAADDAPPADDKPNTYTVQPGDTLGKIAAKFGVDTNALASASGIDNPNLIYVGQVLTIP